MTPRQSHCYPPRALRSVMARRLKILSDFDGVWTNQGPEEALLLDWMIGELAKLAGVPAEQARGELREMCAEMKQAPAAHGWAPDGRISAYLDEDPLVESSALTRVLAQEADDRARRYAAAVKAAGHASLADFSEWCFKTTTASFRDAHPPCIVPDAGDLLKAIEDRLS